MGRARGQVTAAGPDDGRRGDAHQSWEEWELSEHQRRKLRGLLRTHPTLAVLSVDSESRAVRFSVPPKFSRTGELRGGSGGLLYSNGDIRWF